MCCSVARSFSKCISLIFLNDDTVVIWTLANFLKESNMQISKFRMKLLLHLMKNGLFMVLKRRMRLISTFPQGEVFY